MDSWRGHSAAKGGGERPSGRTGSVGPALSTKREWGHVPRSLSFSLSLLHDVSSRDTGTWGTWGCNTGEGGRDEGCGRRVRCRGRAAYDPARRVPRVRSRMVYRARLITSRGCTTRCDEIRRFVVATFYSVYLRTTKTETDRQPRVSIQQVS